MEISEYKQLFLNEAQEILNSLNNILVRFEKEPANTALLHELFRQCHTLKSMAQSMGYEEIAQLTHSMETALALLRSGKLKAEEDMVELLFTSLDALSDLVKHVKKGTGKKVKVTPLIKKFQGITSAVPKETKRHGGKEGTELSPAETDRHHMTEKQRAVQTVRVPLTQLDSLMNLTGELIINRSRLTQLAQTIEHKALEEAVAQMSRLTAQLQDQIMHIRLVSLEYIFAPYPRMVRDMAVAQKKEVDLLIEGGHIGLDRSIQDEINEPLLHLLKNAVTHGIEKPEKREKLKKPRKGKLKLVARRERNFVVIELSDDGRGIDMEEVKEGVLKKGIIIEEELSRLTPQEVMMLVTLPGYSGAQEVTEAAGRGVGLNASRSKVESFGGTFTIDTRPHEGTTFHIKLPLTMAIVQAMLVGIADETYSIPFSYIVETIKIAPQEIKTMEHHEVIQYRDTVLPLMRLGETFGFASSRFQSSTSDTSTRIPSIPVVVVEAGSRKAGLVVDRLLGQQEAVIKSLTGVLKEVRGTSGATILGTGRVALIVDVPSLL